eukprot:TRINITY_DN227_c0_g1_i3.p1 TRINITY_DN227_c0_g1~~TRINITY_DN227_c0_g1_i3.p1  ORF type:complete len:192 (+),score=44.60 TRINITY_DN227_c0_g1_i3:57-632(+)
MSRVYVGHLPSDIRESELRDLFRRCGRIRRVDIKNGYAFLDFDDRRDAEDAVRDFDGSRYDGARISVELARTDRRSERPRRTDYRVLVDNLSSRTSWQDLKDFLRKVVDSIPYADVYKDGTGVVEFETERDMLDVIDRLDGKELDGKVIRLRESPGNSEPDGPLPARVHALFKHPLPFACIPSVRTLAIPS